MRITDIKRVFRGMAFKSGLLILIAVSLLALSVSCDASGVPANSVETTIVVGEEKYLTHVQVDGIASYGYEAENLSAPGAYGETEGESILILKEDGTASIGYLEAGLWKFTVRAYNSRGALLYVGTTEANVSKDNNIVNVVLALQKTGTGTATFTITSRCTGDGSSLEVFYQSYDGTVGGQSSDFTCSCDGLTDTWTGKIEIAENRYKLTVRLSTVDTYLASDVTDLLILNGQDIAITGVLDGQENQSASVTPVDPVKPEGHITLSGHAKANTKITASWAYENETEKPESVVWYLDGEQVGTGLEVTLTLPDPGMHSLSATATLGTECVSDSYKLELYSTELQLVGGTIIKDKGTSYGTYWFDEYNVYYRKGTGEVYRYLVVNFFDEKSTQFYTYTEALALAEELESLGYKGYRIPTKTDAQDIISAISSGTINFTPNFWTQTEYNTNNAYMRVGTAISTQSKTTKARVILVKDI